MSSPSPPARSRPVRPGAAAALVPGGWLVMAHGRFTGDPLEDAINRFKTVAYGGTALDDDQAQELLRSAGLSDVRTVQSPPGMPGLTAGRRPD